MPKSWIPMSDFPFNILSSHVNIEPLNGKNHDLNLSFNSLDNVAGLCGQTPRQGGLQPLVGSISLGSIYTQFCSSGRKKEMVAFREMDGTGIMMLNETGQIQMFCLTRRVQAICVCDQDREVFQKKKTSVGSKELKVIGSGYDYSTRYTSTKISMDTHCFYN